MIYPREYVETRSPVGSHAPTVNWMMGLASVHEALMMGRPEEARARSALMFAAGEQMALDGGCWTLAWLARPRYSMAPRRGEGDDQEP